MYKEKHPYVCPAELAGSLDNSLRRLFHKPWKILDGSRGARSEKVVQGIEINSEARRKYLHNRA